MMLGIIAVRSSGIILVNCFISTSGKVTLPQGSEPASGSLNKEKVCVLKSRPTQQEEGESTDDTD